MDREPCGRGDGANETVDGEYLALAVHVRGALGSLGTRNIDTGIIEKLERVVHLVVRLTRGNRDPDGGEGLGGARSLLERQRLTLCNVGELVEK